MEKMLITSINLPTEADAPSTSRNKSNTQVSNLDIKMSNFSDENSLNQLQFLEVIAKYFELKNINNDRKRIEPMLSDKVRLWYDLRGKRW